MKKVTPFLSNQAGSSRMDTVLKMLLIAFIALLAFSSGVYFGKQLSDSDYQLKALESDFNNNHGKVADGSHDAGPEEALNREEATALSESLAEKLVSGEKSELAQKDAQKDAPAEGHAAEHADTHKAEARKVASNEGGHHEAASEHAAAPQANAHAAAPAAAHGHETAHTAAAAQPAHAPAPAAAHPQAHAAEPAADAHQAAHKPDLSAATKAAIRVANNAAPAEAPKADNTPRVPTSLPKTVGLSQDVEFTVQVASYPTAEVAKERADELVKKGFPAFPVEATVNGKVWYRVSVGSFKTQREATAYRAQLLKQANLSSAIVQKITR